MLKRIVAIAFIFLCASAAWMVLGATVFSRTYDSDQVLEGQVTSLWGAPQSQSPPAARAEYTQPKTTETVVDGKKRSFTEQVAVVEAGCALMRSAPFKHLARHVFFGRGSFPDVESHRRAAWEGLLPRGARSGFNSRPGTNV